MDCIYYGGVDIIMLSNGCCFFVFWVEMVLGDLRVVNG